MKIETVKQQKAVVLWTGGKDCALALYIAHKAGYLVEKLVTFAPPDARFRAHSLQLMQYQAEALGIPHTVYTVTEPFKESYQSIMRLLQEQEGIEVLVTGDIDEVAGYSNWVRECAEPLQLEVFTPLWKRDRLELLHQFIDVGFKILFSCVKTPWLTADWLGKEINGETIQALQRKALETSLDLCGEQGEYHSIVLDGPLFMKEIQIPSVTIGVDGSLMYIEIQEMILTPK